MASTRSLKQDIKETRARIGEDIDKLGAKVSPVNISSQLAVGAKSALGQTQDAVVGTVESLSETVAAEAQGIGASLVDSIKRNPLPATIIGLGLGLLVANSSRQNAKTSNASATATTGTISNGDTKALPEVGTSSYQSEGIGDKAYDVSANTQKHARQAKRGVAKFIDEQPLAAGGVAALLGLGLGLAFPTTRVEDDIMGEKSDELINSLRAKANDAVDVAKESAQDAVATLKAKRDEIPNPIESTKENLKEVAAKAQEAVSEAASSAKSTAKTSAKKKGLTSSSRANSTKKTSARSKRSSTKTSKS